MLSVHQLCSGYDGIQILNGVSMEVASGAAVGILGHNGMGKTTLLKTLIGILRATAGDIRLEGELITRTPIHRRARLGLGYVPQGREIFPALTVIDNLRFAAHAAGQPEREAIEETLEEFPRLRNLLDRQGAALSGGEQQLLALARCLCQRPRIVLLDEPTEGIQPSIIAEILEQLIAIRARRGLTIVLVEQNVDFIRALSDQVLLIQKGAIVRQYAPGELSDAAAMGHLSAS